MAYSIVFSRLFNEYGPVNRLLSAWFGISVPWFTNPDCAMLSIALIVTWKFVGYYGLILYSGMQAIPSDIYSAAILDKTGRFQKGWAITLPMMNPQIVMVMVLAITVAFSIFTEPYLITGGHVRSRVSKYETYLGRCHVDYRRCLQFPDDLAISSVIRKTH